MSKERFIERQAGVRESATRQIYGHIVQDYAPLLGGMAEKIQTLKWD